MNYTLNIPKLIFLLAMYVIGLVFTLAAVFNWDWFFERAAFHGVRLSTFMSRKAMRIEYGIMGIALLTAAVCFTVLGILNPGMPYSFFK